MKRIAALDRFIESVDMAQDTDYVRWTDDPVGVKRLISVDTRNRKLGRAVSRVKTSPKNYGKSTMQIGQITSRGILSGAESRPSKPA